ncbi:MAG: GNAT family N-acetyltransferase [Lachnospiraceae bacterium]|jgi:hypothetical protein|nr:GNAT family N-acetyltransferase [Lachnospiraceae bacterium]
MVDFCVSVRKAVFGDLPAIMLIIEQAKVFLRDCGIKQWQDGYPQPEDIESDIENKEGYVLVKENGFSQSGSVSAAIAGYFCLAKRDEPDYAIIDGAWLNDEPYGVIHRSAIDNESKGKGLSKVIFDFAKKSCIEDGIYNLRVDTQDENTRMQHIILKNGYTFCGIVQVPEGPRKAYQINFRAD